jgi:hypothetical protein
MWQSQIKLTLRTHKYCGRHQEHTGANLHHRFLPTYIRFRIVINFNLFSFFNMRKKHKKSDDGIKVNKK